MYLSFPHYFCDQTELGSTSPKWSKARLLTLHCGEAEYSAYCRASGSEDGTARARNTQTPDGVQGRVFKDGVRDGVGVLWLVDGEVTECYFRNLFYPVSGHRSSGVCVLAAACMRAKSLGSCLTLCDPMDCSPPGSSVPLISLARIL